jgi:hypothetical protein
MPAFNYNPMPQYGSGAFGSVPGPLTPPNPASNLSGVIPKLGAINSAASGDILSSLQGTLSPGTEHALQNASAEYGVSSGMPGSGLDWNSLYGNIAEASEAQQQKGLQDYSSFIPTVNSTQTLDPGLQTNIEATNASNAAAPNPGASASYASQLFNQYLNQFKNPAGGGTFGSGVDSLTGFPNWNGGGGSGGYESYSFPSGAFSSLGDSSQYAGTM